MGFEPLVPDGKDKPTSARTGTPKISASSSRGQYEAKNGERNDAEVDVAGVKLPTS